MSRNSQVDAAKAETIFRAFEGEFPDLQDGDKINTSQFLGACKGIIIIVEKLGKVFAPVRHDLQGNIKKITKKYSQDVAKYEYIEDMILDEKDSGEVVTTDALMWLRRGLHFLLLLFQGILRDYEEERLSDVLTSYLKESYELSLQRYHGWLGSQLFNVLSRYASSTKSFFTTLALNSENQEPLVIEDMKIFTKQLSKCVEQLVRFYAENDLEVHYVV